MRIPATLFAALFWTLSATAPAAAVDPPPGTQPTAEAKAPRIDLNSASLDALLTLEEVTPERARAIVENRENRCYESAAELLDRKILPKAAYDRIKDRVKAAPCVRSDPPAAVDAGKRGK